MKNKKTCVILLNMGGPSSLDDVQPFLYNLFMDPDIIDIPLGRFIRPFIAKKISTKRALNVRTYYEKIGGGSPLLRLTMEQAGELEKALAGEGDYKVLVAMRYWHPFTEETVKKVLLENPDNILLLPLYPQYSSTTTGSSLNEFYRVWKKAGRRDVEISEVKEWHREEAYIDSWARTIMESLGGSSGKEWHILFSAHGIPQKLVDKGDPYQAQTEETVRMILNRLDWKGPWSISYQSRVGPVKWLEPATDLWMKELAEKGTRNLLMVPISFVSDHSETLYEMDILYKDLAADAGIESFMRAPSLNSREIFIGALKNIVLKNCRVI